MQFLKKLKNIFLALLPIVVIVFLVHFFFYKIDTGVLIAFIVSVTVDALNNVEEYSAKINNHLHEWTFDRLGYVEQAILLLAASELETGDLDRAIVVNDDIELTKKFCDDAAYKLINGVLDQL